MQLIFPEGPGTIMTWMTTQKNYRRRFKTALKSYICVLFGLGEYKKKEGKPLRASIREPVLQTGSFHKHSDSSATCPHPTSANIQSHKLSGSPGVGTLVVQLHFFHCHVWRLGQPSCSASQQFNSRTGILREISVGLSRDLNFLRGTLLFWSTVVQRLNVHPRLKFKVSDRRDFSLICLQFALVFKLVAA